MHTALLVLGILAILLSWAPYCLNHTFGGGSESRFWTATLYSAPSFVGGILMLTDFAVRTTLGQGLLIAGAYLPFVPCVLYLIARLLRSYAMGRITLALQLLVVPAWIWA